jgi:hypothetical protein
MNCWSCGFPNLIWGGDNDTPEGYEYEIETNLSCPRCDAFVIVYHQLRIADKK